MPLPLASRGGLCYDEEKPFSRREDLSMEFTYPQGLKKALTFSYDDAGSSTGGWWKSSTSTA